MKKRSGSKPGSKTREPHLAIARHLPSSDGNRVVKGTPPGHLQAGGDLACLWTPEIICTVMSVPTCSPSSPRMMKALIAQPTSSSRSVVVALVSLRTCMSLAKFQASSPSIVAGAYLSTHIGPTCNTDILLRQAYCTA